MECRKNRKVWGIILAGGEGARAREFLQELRGGHGVKQFYKIVDSHSLLEHTLARVERLIPPERILVAVNQEQYAQASRQLAHWPIDNIIWQPENRDTAPGILLPLAHIGHRTPFATVAVFPSDHFLLDEACFMNCVQRAVEETQRFPRELTLLGVAPGRFEEGYEWIEPGAAEFGRETLPVHRFWEKPKESEAYALLRRNAVWNTCVFTAQAATLWEMIRQAAPDLYADFMMIRRTISKPHSALVVDNVYRTMRIVNFFSEVYQSFVERLRVLCVPMVGWSDWDSEKRILDSLQHLHRFAERFPDLLPGKRRDGLLFASPREI